MGGNQVALFASGEVGFRVAKYLVEQGEIISILFLSEENSSWDLSIKEIVKKNQEAQVYVGDLRDNIEKYQTIFEQTKLDALITVYWPFLIPMSIFSLAKKTINFHPAFLPVNRGWYPHVHSIIDGSISGVTMHELSERADQGDIWCQKEVEILPWENAGDIYLRLQQEIFLLFCDSWPLIINGQLESFPQGNLQSTYHSKSEIELLDEIDLTRLYLGRDLINLLRARTFGEKSYAYFKIDKQKYSVKIKITPENF